MKRVLVEKAKRRVQVNLTIVIAVEVDPAEVKEVFGKATKANLIEWAVGNYSTDGGVLMEAEISDEYEVAPAQYMRRAN